MRERVDVAADVDEFSVDRSRLVPGTLWKSDHAGHDAGGYIGRQPYDASIVEDFNHVAFSDAARLGDPDAVGVNASELGQVVEGRVNASVAVISEALQGILFLKSVTGHFPCVPEHGNWRNDLSFEQIPISHALGELLGIDLNLAARRLEFVLFRGIAESLQSNRILAYVPELGHAVFPESCASSCCRRADR